ncbi:MAG TPA: 2-amino-4-hydroxy-6-hydroxymethyldihydropteridine diphosphokinase [Marinagarivorans sp.]
MTHTVFIGLGSNLGDPSSQVKQAVTALDAIADTQLVCCSPWYASVAVGPAQPNYINGVAQLVTGLPPIALLDALQAIEHNHHRVRKERWGPRTLDLDILLWNNTCINSERLTVPHPYLEARSFVLLPLADIAPKLILPNGKSVSALAANCDRSEITRLSPPSNH